MLRVLGPLALAFASSACGAAGPERAAPSAERAPAAAAPSLDGTWLAFEADDERVRARLEIEGRAGVATLLRTRREAPLRVEPPRAGRPGRLDVGVEGRRERLLWVPRGPRRALGLTPEDDDLVLLLRAGPVPEALRGKWVMRRADRREAVARLRFGRDAISATFPGGGGSGEAFGLPSAGDARAVAVAQLDRPDSGRLTVLRMAMHTASAFVPSVMSA